MGDIDLKEIRVVLNTETDSKPYKLIDGEASTPAGVTVSGDTKIIFPTKGGGEKTYIFNVGNVKSVDIYPVLQDKKCDIGKDSLQLSLCS